MTPKLEARELSYHVEGGLIVDAISLAVAERTVLAVVGPSGAGKSTLLRLLNRLDKPDEGTVYIDERDVERLVDRVDLAGYEPRDVGGLSDGERQRVAIARSVFNRPEVLLLDEPTSSLDDAVEEQVETTRRQGSHLRRWENRLVR